MLTKDQAKIIELNYVRVIEGMDYEIKNAVLNNKRPNVLKLEKLRDEFFGYIESITEK